MINLSYGITCYNEHVEMSRLLKIICDYKWDVDEIVILIDDTNPTPTELLDVIGKYSNSNISVHYHKLNKNFGEHKNYLNARCKSDYIVQLDVDETISKILINNIHEIIEMNPNVDLFRVPRINTVVGLGLSHVQKWGWHISKLDSIIEEKVLDTESDEYKLLKQYELIISEEGKLVKYYVPIINAYDYQSRIYRNTPEIHWIHPVHEVTTGHKTVVDLPAEEAYCLYHHKTITRQIFQNNFYSQIN